MRKVAAAIAAVVLVLAGCDPAEPDPLGPDLMIYGTPTVTPTDLTDGDTITVKFSVVNIGDEAAAGGTVALLAAMDIIGTTSFDAVELTDTLALEIMGGPLSAGTHDLTLRIDPDNVIAEADEMNNDRPVRSVEIRRYVIGLNDPILLSDSEVNNIQTFRVDVDANPGQTLVVTLSQNNALYDADLMVAHASEFPLRDLGSANCFSGLYDSNERCELSPIRPGSYTIGVHAYSAYQNVELLVQAVNIEPQFDIDVHYLAKSDDEALNTTITNTIKAWEDIIVSDAVEVQTTLDGHERCGRATLPGLGDITIDDVMVFVVVDSIDGPGDPETGNILGGAGPCYSRVWGIGNPITNETIAVIHAEPTIGVMVLDEYDLKRLPDHRIVDLVKHEMAHVLGLGSLWELGHDLLIDPSLNNPGTDTRFIGRYATEAYRKLGGDGHVPVDNSGRPGSADAHWRTSVFGEELMTPMVPATILSLVTIESMADLNFQVDTRKAEHFKLIGGIPASPYRSSIPVRELIFGPAVADVIDMKRRN